MRWSKLKQRVEECFADAVKGRVEVWNTRYRHAYEQDGEAWISVDGRRLHSISTQGFLKDEWIAKGSPDYRKGESSTRDRQEVVDDLHASGSMELWVANSALFDYLSMSLEDALASDIALIRAIAILDRRLGKRRLATLDTSQAPAFIQELYRFRCDCEGLRPFDALATAPIGQSSSSSG